MLDVHLVMLLKMLLVFVMWDRGVEVLHKALVMLDRMLETREYDLYGSIHMNT